MKKTLRAVGAAGLAASTIVTGLSFGSVAASAATPSSTSAPFQMIWKEDGTYYANVWSTAPTDGSRSDLRSYSSLEAAQADSVQYTYDTVTQQIKVNDKCLHLAALKSDIYLTTCEPSDQSKWSFDEDGTLRSAVYGSSRKVGSVYSTYGVKRAAFVTNSSWSTVESYKGLAADVSDVNLEGGTATLSGVASSDTTDVDISWATAGGSQKNRNVVVEDGKFTHQLTELALGTTTVHLKAWNGGDVIAETDVEVKLEVAPVTAKAEFSSDVMETVQLSGTAQPNAPIEFRHAEKVIGGATTNNSGDWTGTVNAPNEPGPYNIDVVQRVRGEEAGRTALEIDYGAGVTVTSPGEGAVVDPADPELIIRGTAPAGTTVKVYEKGHAATQLAEPRTAGSNGTYRLTTVPLEDREYTLVLEGITKGYNRTRAELIVNPGKASELTPAAVTTTSVVAGKTNTIEGTATKDATLKITNAWGTDLLGKPVTVDSTGHWSFDRAISASAKNFQFKIVQTKGSLTETSDLFTLNAEDPAASLVDPTVTGPAAVQLGVNNTFTGTATKDATMKIVNASGTDLLGHTVTVGSDGKWTFDRVVSRSAKNFTFFIEQTKNGATKKSGPFVINPEDPAASLVDPTVTGPAAVQLGKNNTFTGTATMDATLKIVNASGTDLLGHAVTVGSDGKWTFDRVVSWNAKNFTFYIEQTKNGATKKSGPFVVNPEDPAASLVDPTVTGPATVNLGVNNTFTGTATKDATLKIVNASGTDLVGHTVPVSSTGHWSFDRVVSWNAKNFTFYIEQTKNGAIKKSGPFVIDPTTK